MVSAWCRIAGSAASPLTQRDVSLALAGTYAYVTPIISLVVGATLAHEEVPLVAVLALVLTLFGVYLIKQGMRREVVL